MNAKQNVTSPGPLRIIAASSLAYKRIGVFFCLGLAPFRLFTLALKIRDHMST